MMKNSLARCRELEVDALRDSREQVVTSYFAL